MNGNVEIILLQNAWSGVGGEGTGTGTGEAYGPAVEIANNIPISTGHYQWQVPDISLIPIMVTGDRIFKLQIYTMDKSVAGYTVKFTIVKPNIKLDSVGDITGVVGATPTVQIKKIYSIKWTSEGIGNTVNLSLKSLVNSVSSYSAAIDNSGSYELQIPSNFSLGDAKLKIASTDNSAVYDYKTINIIAATTFSMQVNYISSVKKVDGNNNALIYEFPLSSSWFDNFESNYGFKLGANITFNPSNPLLSTNCVLQKNQNGIIYCQATWPQDLFAIFGARALDSTSYTAAVVDSRGDFALKPANISVFRTDPLGSAYKISFAYTLPTDTNYDCVNIYRSTTSGQLGEKVLACANKGGALGAKTGYSYDDSYIKTNGSGVVYFTFRGVDKNGAEERNNDQYIYRWTDAPPVIKVTSPNDNDMYASNTYGGMINETVKIKWTATGNLATGKTQIWLYKGNERVLLIKSGEFALSTSNEYSWFADWEYQMQYPPIQRGSDFKIRVVNVDNPNVYGDSGTFELFKPLTLLTGYQLLVGSPNGGERWEIGKTYDIVAATCSFFPDYCSLDSIINANATDTNDNDDDYNDDGQPDPSLSISYEAKLIGTTYKGDVVNKTIIKNDNKLIYGPRITTPWKIGSDIESGSYKVWVSVKGTSNDNKQVDESDQSDQNFYIPLPAATGNIIVSKNSYSPSGYINGPAKDIILAKFDFKAVGGDLKLVGLPVNFSGTSETNNNNTIGIYNVKLVDEDDNVIGKIIPSVTYYQSMHNPYQNGALNPPTKVEFGTKDQPLNYVIPVGVTKTINVVADVGKNYGVNVALNEGTEWSGSVALGGNIYDISSQSYFNTPAISGNALYFTYNGTPQNQANQTASILDAMKALLLNISEILKNR